MTDAAHPSGTDRIAEVAAGLPDDTIVVNVQGDEPFIRNEQLAAVTAPLYAAHADIATLAAVIREESALFSPSTVKVVIDGRNRALYFSRHAIPYLRDIPLGRWIEEEAHLHHIGVYAFRNSILQELTKLAVTPLEGMEMLEQLRWLHAGHPIHVARCQPTGRGIDTQVDLEEARAFILRKRRGQ
jgi:3-deoxy-manno-octulosonate cytidylyltransferase (CMP-KDO synthetase)